MKTLETKLAITLLITCIIAIALTLFINRQPEKTTVLSVVENKQEVVEKGFKKKDFICTPIEDMTFCYQHYTPKAGLQAMGEYHSIDDTIFVRLTDNTVHNIGRLFHEMVHYLLYDTLEKFTVKQILTVRINEELAYNYQRKFEKMLNLII